MKAAGYELSSYSWSPESGLATITYERTIAGIVETETIYIEQHAYFVMPAMRARL